MIDLHIHTTASDGLLTPKKVIYWAHKKNLKAVAITDHDTTNGIQEALIAGRRYNITVVPGIEINTNLNALEIHILGYYINYKDKEFQNCLSEIRNARYHRAEKIINRLKQLGIMITMDEVVNTADTATIGRPHIARVLEKHHYVKNKKEAFEKYIGEGKPAFVERYKITPIEAIKTILDNGGIPVLAHPGLINTNSTTTLIKELVKAGLQGIEVIYTKHSKDTQKYFYNIAKQYHLLITGGSDCHGDLHGGQPILGSLDIDKKYLDLLKVKKNHGME